MPSIEERIQEKQAQYTEFLETFQRLGAEQDAILDKETGLENEQGLFNVKVTMIKLQP